MFGFLIGSACLVGLAAARCRGARGPRGCGSYSGDGACARGGGSGGGGRRGIFGFLASLNLSRTQWKVAHSAFEELRDEVHKQRPESRKTREELAALISGATFEEGAFGPMFARHDAVLAVMRPAFARSFAKVHAVLEPGQRDRLAELVELGPAWMGMARGACR